jgi:subtilisin family serine protease
MPSASPAELGKAIIDVVSAGAGVINLSAALAQPSGKGERQLTEALDYAASRGVLVVAAAGNQGTVGSSAITRHSWVIPVVCCDVQGKPAAESNLGASMGRRGLRVPAASITSLGTNGQSQTLGGTSAAAPFVTGAIALLSSEFPAARAGDLKIAITRCGRQLPNTILPPLLNAWAAYELLAATHNRRTLS